MNRQLSTLISKFNIVGVWEYNPIADKMRLCPTASRIYFGNSKRNEVDIGELFGALSPKSSQHLSRVLSSRVKVIQSLANMFMIGFNIKGSDGNSKGGG